MTVELPQAFARRLRAAADHAEKLKFSVANLSTLPIADCRALADWIDAHHPPAFVETENPEDRFLRDAEVACPHCGGSGHKDDATPAATAEAERDALREAAEAVDESAVIFGPNGDEAVSFAAMAKLRAALAAKSAGGV